MSDLLEGFRVTFQVRAKHAALLAAARQVGGVKKLAELCDVPASLMFRWISMREVPNFRTPKAANSRWLKREWMERFEKTIFSLTHQTLDDLWPEEICGKDFADAPKSGEFTGGYDLRMLSDHNAAMLSLPSPHEAAEQDELRTLIAQRLQTLPWREREVIKLRYGIPDGQQYTLEECGRIFKVTRDRVRQIEAVALRKLQHPLRTVGLREYAGLPEDEQ